LQDTHISVVVGVNRNGQPGAITVNNPQYYENGRFGNAFYTPIFVRPVYPRYLNAGQLAAFNDNLRTVLIGFNAVTHVTERDYNGADPLAANTVEKVRRHTAMMVRAIAGDPDGAKFFKEPDHQVYCSELAFLAASAGVIVPLNAKTMAPMVGEEVWKRFVQEVNAHNAGKTSAFTRDNANRLVRLVRLTLAPEDLEPGGQYAAAEDRAAELQRLAFRPMTMSDMIEHFLRTHVPREQLGEQLAPAQGALLARMKPALLQSLGLEQLPPTDGRRKAAEALLDWIVAVVSKPHASYEEFRKEIAPVLAEARRAVGPLGDEGAGLFTPPSLFHVVAEGKHAGGVLGLEYVGHGLHFSTVRRGETTAKPGAASKHGR
jgi:hypothetical protein